MSHYTKKIFKEKNQNIQENKILQASIRVTEVLYKLNKSQTNYGKDGRKERRIMLINEYLSNDLNKCRPIFEENEDNLKSFQDLQKHIIRLKKNIKMTANTELTCKIYAILYLKLDEKYKFLKYDTEHNQDKLQENLTYENIQNNTVDITIIIDTNTVMHYKNIFRIAFEICDIKDYITFYVPWRVHGELDKLQKYRGEEESEVAYLARNAIKFLLNAYSDTNQKWKQQTCIEWEEAKTIFEARCADDEILQSAIQLLQSIKPNQEILFWTEDKNLQIKAIANAISCCDAENLIETISNKIKQKK